MNLSVTKIKPSPLNQSVYGKITDGDVEDLLESIRKNVNINRSAQLMDRAITEDILALHDKLFKRKKRAKNKQTAEGTEKKTKPLRYIRIIGYSLIK